MDNTNNMDENPKYDILVNTSYGYKINDDDGCINIITRGGSFRDGGHLLMKELLKNNDKFVLSIGTTIPGFNKGFIRKFLFKKEGEYLRIYGTYEIGSITIDLSTIFKEELKYPHLFLRFYENCIEKDDNLVKHQKLLGINIKDGNIIDGMLKFNNIKKEDNSIIKKLRQRIKLNEENHKDGMYDNEVEIELLKQFIFDNHPNIKSITKGRMTGEYGHLDIEYNNIESLSDEQLNRFINNPQDIIDKNIQGGKTYTLDTNF